MVESLFWNNNCSIWFVGLSLKPTKILWAAS
nr:MAG TPA: hypothetical protein [Crassvirales sp.]